MPNLPLCYCCSNKNYTDCCAIYLTGQRNAPSAEALMRSRYSAFCTGNSDYLIKTLHPSHREHDDATHLESTLKNTQWLGLKIIAASTNTVEFIAFYQQNPIGQLHERSRFVQEDGQWFYTTGDMLPNTKIHRNDICICGSNKKFKKCCGLN